MSSHREAPEISKDPVADNTDTYAFISPDRPDTVTILTNYIPLEAAAGGPTFYEFGNDVLYSIHISNSGTGRPDITYEFRFETEVLNPKSFLYNTGPISSLNDPHFNRRQFYSVTKVLGAQDVGPVSNGGGRRQVLATRLASPPVNVGLHSTPNYPALAQAAVHPLPGGGKVFAGQRNDGFYADLGAIFDLGDLRPFQNHFAFPPVLGAASGLDTLKLAGFNVHTIAIQVPITELTNGGGVRKNATFPQATLPQATLPQATLGIWGAASRRKARLLASAASRRKAHLRGHQERAGAESGPFVQVSRLGNPLFNELLVDMGRKDMWNRGQPLDDKNFVDRVIHPELAALLPVLYPGVFPNLDALNKSGKPRADLVAILLTGIPPGIIPGFQNFTSNAPADMLRLNVAIPPSKTPNALGLLGGDLAGFPNGRRVDDDIVTIELRALAGVTYALIDKTFTPDAAAKALTDGVVVPPTGAPGTARFLPFFPYLGIPNDGFDTPPDPTPPPAT